MTALDVHTSAWLDWARRNGVPAAGRDAVPAQMRPCYEIMNDHAEAIPSLTTSLGQLQAWLHDMPAAGAPGAVLDWPAALARLDDRIESTPDGIGVDVPLLREQRQRLGDLDPGPTHAVPCHGSFSPVTLCLNPDDHRDVVIIGWSEAVLADREYDVSFSELGFWASPYLVADPEVRTMLKLARSFLSSGYLAGYRSVARELDEHRQRVWGAFHTCSTLASPLHTVAPFCDWDPDVARPVLDAFRTDLAERFDALADDTATVGSQEGDHGA
jgi:hypothetical protein